MPHPANEVAIGRGNASLLGRQHSHVSAQTWTASGRTHEGAGVDEVFSAVRRHVEDFPHLFAGPDDGDTIRWLEAFAAWSPIVHLQQTDGTQSAHLNFTPENNAPAARVHGMAKEWARSGHRVTVLTCAPNVPAGIVYEGYENRWRQMEWIDGIRTVRVWTYVTANRGRVRRGLSYLSYMATAALVGSGLRPRPDVVVATTPQFFAGWAGLPVSRVHHAPFVLDVRDIWPDSIVAVGALRDGRLVRALGRLERALYGRADHIVAVGEGYRANIIRKGIAPSKVSVITNGVDTGLFQPREPDGELRARLGFAPETFVITFAGTIGMASGLEVVLDAARLLRAKGRDDIAFLLVGDGAVRAALEARARSEGLTNVVFTGLVPRRDGGYPR